MALTLADVHRIAHLARIEIDAAAATEVHRKLEAIFAMINELQAVDTTGIVPMAHAQDVMLPLRDDVVTESDRHVLFQSLAPAVQDGLYLVPKGHRVGIGSAGKGVACAAFTDSSPVTVHTDRSKRDTRPSPNSSPRCVADRYPASN